jgi:hypothetical protein
MNKNALRVAPITPIIHVTELPCQIDYYSAGHTFCSHQGRTTPTIELKIILQE